MTRLLIFLAIALACVHSLVVERRGLQSSGEKEEQPVSECQVTLDNSGTINGLDLCGRAPDDGSKYPNNANWNFRYSNNQPTARWVNIRYRVDLEDSENCDRDSLAFGGSADPERVVLCGQQAGSFSIPVGPRDTFTVHFKSDYSVAGAGFILSYSIGIQPAFPVSDQQRTLKNPSPAEISPTRTQVSGRSDFSEYVYPEYDYYPDSPRQYQAYQYYTYPDYDYNYPRGSVYSGYQKYPDTYQHTYPGYPANTDSSDSLSKVPQVKAINVLYNGYDQNVHQRSGSQSWNYQPRQFLRHRREAEN